MKVRSGFVSNSNTSSFIVVTTKEEHEKVMAQLVPWERKVVKAIMTEGKVGPQEVYYGFDFSNCGGEGTMDWVAEEVNLPEAAEKEDEDGYDGVYHAWDKYLKLLDDNNTLSFDAGDGG